MKRIRDSLCAVAAMTALTAAPLAHAQFAVIDVAALVQLVQQLAVLEQEYATLQNQLQQARQQYRSLTGGRGMENLLSGIDRNYLPTTSAALEAALKPATTTAYPDFTAAVRASITANAVLTPAEVNTLSAPEQAQLQRQRQTVALLQATVEQALATTSDRFDSIQQLIDAIGGASDTKASLDLQDRIAAEEGMIGTDQTKLQILYQAAEAESWAEQQRTREEVMAGTGSLRALPAMGLQ